MYLSGLDLGIIIGATFTILVIFFSTFFYLDKKIDDLKENLNATKTELERLENKLETLNPIMIYIKEVGENEARKTFEVMRKVKK